MFHFFKFIVKFLEFSPRPKITPRFIWKFVRTNIQNWVFLVISKLIKISLLSFIVFFLSFILGVEFHHLDTGSDSDSDSESAPKPAKGKGVTSPDSDSELGPDSIGTYKRDVHQFTEANAPRSTFGSSHTVNSRIQGIMAKFIALDLEDRTARVKKLGLDKMDYSEMSPEQQRDMDALESTQAALAKASQEQATSDSKSEQAKRAYNQAAGASNYASMVPKRELEEVLEEASSKKVFSGGDLGKDSLLKTNLSEDMDLDPKSDSDSKNDSLKK